MNKHLVNVLNNKGIAIIKTDTLYGVVGSAYDPEIVERIYELKGRDEDKPFIILIDSAEALEKFGIVLDGNLKKRCLELWQEQPTSIIFHNIPDRFSYLYRGKESLAFRIPYKESLRELISETGPLVAPSANPQGLQPASNIEQAQKYFHDQIDYYHDEGRCDEVNPSCIVDIQTDGSIEYVRGF